MTILMWDYDKFVEDLLKKHDINHKVVLFDKPIPMAYSPAPIEFRINILAINRYINGDNHPKLTDEEILSIMTYHEIGHCLDSRKHPPLDLKAIRIKTRGTMEEWIKFTLEREKNAWKYGRELVPEHLISEYDKLNEKNMELYRNMDYSKYQE